MSRLHMAEQSSERQRATGSGFHPQRCPWCGGRLQLAPAFPRHAMIPGDVSAWADGDVPETFRTVRAWVCGTPHCRYRESA